MSEFLSHPAVQAGVAPFIVGLAAAAILVRLRFGGLAVVAGFATAVALIAGFEFTPLTATRKIILLAMLAAVIGIGMDFGFRAGRVRSALLALLGALLTLWVFWPVLAQKPAASAWLLGVVAIALVAWLVGYTDRALAERPVQACVAALLMGLGAGALAILGGSASYGQYGIAIGAGAGALLLLMMLRGRTFSAGSTLALPASLLAGLLVAGAMILAQLQWYAAMIFALTPVFARIPAAARRPIWIQAFAHSFVALVPVIVACLVAYVGSRGPAST